MFKALSSMLGLSNELPATFKPVRGLSVEQNEMLKKVDEYVKAPGIEWTYSEGRGRFGPRGANTYSATVDGKKYEVAYGFGPFHKDYFVKEVGGADIRLPSNKAGICKALYQALQVKKTLSSASLPSREVALAEDVKSTKPQ